MHTKKMIIAAVALLAYCCINVNAQEKPSVLLINVDDWNTVLKGYSQAITPNIARLAEQGAPLVMHVLRRPVCPRAPRSLRGLPPSSCRRRPAVSYPMKKLLDIPNSELNATRTPYRKPPFA
jgi:hypothetical protein